jgi:hypothetical protein
MVANRLTRQIALFAGGAAIVGMGAFTSGCSQHAEDAPSTSTTPSSVTPSPTEKAVAPGGRGPNSFSPTVATPPGSICKSVNGNDCAR